MYQSANVCLVFTTERVYELPIPPEIMRIVQCLLKSSKTSLKNARVRDTGGGEEEGERVSFELDEVSSAPIFRYYFIDRLSVKPIISFIPRG